MTIWDWIRDFYREAIKNDDKERIRLVEFQSEGYKHRETDPATAMRLFEQGSKLAKQLNEPCWVLIYDNWRVTGMLFFLRDFRNVLDLAVANALEVRKPQYDHFPLRFSILRDLVEAYIGIEPLAYLDQIQQTLDVLEPLAAQDSSDRYLLLGTRRDLAIEIGDFDEAEQVAWRNRELFEADPDRSRTFHHGAFNCCGLCEIAWHKRDFELLEGMATEGEDSARRMELRMEQSSCLIWRAVAARAAGKTTDAEWLFRRGTSQVSRLRMPPDRSFFQGLCAYHELGGETEMILKVRRAQLETIKDTGRLAEESRTRNRICRLLVQLGLPAEEELTKAREAAGRLKKPEASLAELDAIMAGR